MPTSVPWTPEIAGASIAVLSGGNQPMIKVVTTNVQTTACVNMDTGLIFRMVAPPFLDIVVLPPNYNIWLQ